jgi:hypothetical protein
MALSFDTVGVPSRKRDVFDQRLGMLHFVDGEFLEGLVQLLEAPVRAHLRVHHVHADGRQFLGEPLVEYPENLRVPFHGSLLYDPPAPGGTSVDDRARLHRLGGGAFDTLCDSTLSRPFKTEQTGIHESLHGQWHLAREWKPC